MKIETKIVPAVFAPVTVSFTFESQKELDEALAGLGSSTEGGMTSYNMYKAVQKAREDRAASR